jgi:hypothetical protein
MTKVILILALMNYMACGTHSKQQQEAQSIVEEWIGTPVHELKRHSYYKNLPHTITRNKDGADTWIFKDESRWYTRAYCDSLGGCIEEPTINCISAFSVRDDVIIGFEQNGSCPIVDPD